MATVSRREFLARCRTTGFAAAGVTVLGNAASVRGAPANERIVMAVVGIRGRGSSLAPGFAARKDCRIAYICDVDSRLFASRAKMIAEAQGGQQPACVQDFRKALDDKSVDAMVVATPDHWHVPAAIWSCQAGKDVYVEKPLSHNAWEGRKLVEAARKHKRVVQVGTQNRSAAVQHGRQEVHRRGQAGPHPLLPHLQPEGMGQLPLAPDGDPPAGFDWDMWNGPAPRAPLQPHLRQRLAPPLALLGRRHGQRRQPPDRPGPLGPGARLSRRRSIRRAAASTAAAPPKRPTRRPPSGSFPT